MDDLYLFPSPCGDYGSYRQQYFINKFLAESFRPLAGIMVLICSSQLS